jgi:hypothetical protein
MVYDNRPSPPFRGRGRGLSRSGRKGEVGIDDWRRIDQQQGLFRQVAEF